MSDLTAEREMSFLEDPPRTPLMEASIELPPSILDRLGGDIRSSLRVTSFTMTEDTLFVLNENSTVSKALMSGELTLGNIFIAASLSTTGVVENLDEPVVIHFIQTEVRTHKTLMTHRMWYIVNIVNLVCM